MRMLKMAKAVGGGIGSSPCWMWRCGGRVEGRVREVLGIVRRDWGMRKEVADKLGRLLYMVKGEEVTCGIKVSAEFYRPKGPVGDLVCDDLL